MIRRLFWLSLGAALGIAAPRPVTAAARVIMPAPRARELARFAGDVREGMDIYRQRQLQRHVLPSRGAPTSKRMAVDGVGRDRPPFPYLFLGARHTVVPSASVIADDPTLLLVNAGMQPFKPYFLGQANPPFRRATSAQKCIRTPDIEEVGKTTRHGTFFQMLGNFSFGDYFKEQAIPFAWELLTTPERDGGFGFPEDRLWATVYHDDDEAARIWRDVVGVPESRIQRRGMADNFWSMGVPGPCRPCSEIYYDRGPDYGRDGGPVVERGPLPGGVEPRLHAVPAGRGSGQGGLAHPGRAALPQHRHRHGPGADGRHPAGRGQHLRG